MSSHMINLFLCILSSLYLCFGLLYFCCRILPSKHKISLPLFLCLSVSFYTARDLYSAQPDIQLFTCRIFRYRTLQHPAWPVSSLENIRNPAAVYRLFENTHLFTTVTATDRSGFSQCYNFPSEKARSSAGSEHHLLDHMHRQLSVVSACSPFFSPTAQGIFTEKNGN